jgi:LacI family transcriptional regulator
MAHSPAPPENSRPGRRPQPPFRIQLMIDPSLAYFREATLGVRQYGFASGRLEIIDRWLEHERLDLAGLVRRDRVQGIITACHRPHPEARLARLGIPVVNVSNTMLNPRTTVVTQDDFEVGRLAAEHLSRSGCRQFAFWGQTSGRYSIERLAGFKAGLKILGGTLDVQEMPSRYGRREFLRILRWLSRKPTPLGVFAVLDDFALLVLRAARELNWSVPDDVAVLGAGDDDFLVGYERTPLSSIRLPAKRIGYEAGAEIDRLIANPREKQRTVRLEPLGIDARQSTDTIFVKDDAVVKAVRYIRSCATSSPYIEDVARASGIARTTLQKRFQAALGHTMLDEIQRVRIDVAKDLLRSSELSLELISERCGFSSSQRFSVLFRQQTGMPPNRFRRSVR